MGGAPAQCGVRSSSHTGMVGEALPSPPPPPGPLHDGREAWWEGLGPPCMVGGMVGGKAWWEGLPNGRQGGGLQPPPPPPA